MWQPASSTCFIIDYPAALRLESAADGRFLEHFETRK